MYYSSSLKECPDHVNSLLTRKKYLEATQKLVGNLSFVETVEVDGLIELKNVLQVKKETLYKTLLEDLTKQLYVESTWEISQLRRNASTRDNPFQRAGSARGSSGGKDSNRSKEISGRGSGRRQGDNIKARRMLMESTAAQLSGRLMTVTEEEEWSKIAENPSAADPAFSSAHAMVVDIECLAKLNKLPEAIEVILFFIFNGYGLILLS